MDNFLGGFHAVILGLKDTLFQVADYPLFWGFSLGFLTSTIVHAFVVSEHPRDVPVMLFQEQSKSFEKLYATSSKGTYTKSYAEYSTMVRRIKILFFIASSFMVILLIAALVLR